MQEASFGLLWLFLLLKKSLKLLQDILLASSTFSTFLLISSSEGVPRKTDCQTLEILGSMEYLLDGYNILFREKDSDGSLEEQRVRLFEKLNLLAEASHLNLIVVLDSHRQAGELERHHFHSLEVVYTDFDQTADDYIIEYVECLATSKRHRTKVVTSDKLLMQKVRFERVEVLSVSAFFSEIERKAHSRLSKKTKPHQSTPRSKAEKSPPPSPSLSDNASWVALFEGRVKHRDDTVL